MHGVLLRFKMPSAAAATLIPSQARMHEPTESDAATHPWCRMLAPKLCLLLMCASGPLVKSIPTCA
eukprot:5248389-Amphidinium_carterae.1